MTAEPAAVRRPTRVWRRLRRAVLRRRRLLAALLVAVAIAAGVRAVAAPSPATVQVWVASADLSAGDRLTEDDVQPREFLPDSVPAGALRSSPAGEVLAAPVRAGEPLTSVRLWDDELVSSYDDRVSLPVRLPDAAAVGLLEPGDAVDLWGTGARGGGADVVALDARVVTVPPPGDANAQEPAGRLVVLALDPDDVAAVTAAQAQRFLSFSLVPLQ